MSLSWVTAATSVMLPTGNHVNLMNLLILTEFVSIVTSEQSKVSICLCVCLCTAVGTCYVLDNHIPSTFDSGWFLLVNKLFKHWWCDESALYSHTGYNMSISSLWVLCFVSFSFASLLSLSNESSKCPKRITNKEMSMKPGLNMMLASR